MIKTYAKILADSIDYYGQRITTFELYFPRIVNAELLRHRSFAFSSASSRAIPFERHLKDVIENLYIPEEITLNQSGMQGFTSLSNTQKINFDFHIRKIFYNIVEHTKLIESGIKPHKQFHSRYLEPFEYIKVILTGTEFDNFFNQRIHPSAHPEINTLASKMKDAMNASVPKYLDIYEWHLPFIFEDELIYDNDNSLLERETLVKVSAARCARVSYNNFDNNKRDIQKDLELYEKLTNANPPHLSPFEHVAMCTDLVYEEYYENGNWIIQNKFGCHRGWKSLRFFKEETK